MSNRPFATLPSTGASTDTPTPDRPLAGIALRLLSVLLLAIMFAGVKLAATRGVHIVESLFYRQICSALFAALWVLAGPGLASLRTQRVGAHVTRMMIGLTAMALNFLAMVLLPLAEATTIGFTVPIFATLLAALLLREPTGRWRWGAVAAGFVGVLVIVQPGSGMVAPIGAAVALAGALLTAAVTIVIRRLGATEAATTTVFWFAASSLAPLGLLMLHFGQAHDAATWGIVAVMGIAGGAAQLALTGALRLAPVAVVMPMDYTSLIWATMFGAILFGQLPGTSTWIGAPIIIISGIVIVWREHALGRRAVREAVSDGGE